MKVCARCQVPQDDGGFTRDRSRKDGMCPYCKVCYRILINKWGAANADRKKASRDRWLNKEGNREKQRQANQNWKTNNPDRVKNARFKREHGGSLEEFKRKLGQQGGCAICKSPIPTKRGWEFDHSHSTGRPRGVLCHKCNLLLAHCGDNPQILFNAIEYLRMYGNQI
jgi:hypothetical protein